MIATLIFPLLSFVPSHTKEEEEEEGPLRLSLDYRRLEIEFSAIETDLAENLSGKISLQMSFRSA